MMLLPLVASAYDIEVKNAYGVSIYYNYINDGTELAVTFHSNIYYNSYHGNIVIPEEVTFMNRSRKLTSIDKRAFYNCSNLTSVTIPNSVTSIGVEAFYNCSGLTSITIPNSVEIIGENAFGWCSGLTSIDIPNSVWRIDREAFFACSGLKSIKVEEGNPVYDSRDNCNAIIETRYNNLLTGCQNTRIPDSVTDIDYGAFYRCTDLKSITIPNSVVIIGESAFKECGLTEIISKIENPLAIDTNTFSDSTYNNATLYVPKGTIEKYKAQEGWKKFVNIKEK